MVINTLVGGHLLQLFSLLIKLKNEIEINYLKRFEFNYTGGVNDVNGGLNNAG